MHNKPKKSALFAKIPIFSFFFTNFSGSLIFGIRLSNPYKPQVTFRHIVTFSYNSAFFKKKFMQIGPKLAFY